MRMVRALHAGAFCFSLVLSGSFVFLASGCDEGKKETTVVPGADAKQLETEKNAREKFMQDEAAKKKP